jgi:hypothetical protein
LNTPECVGRKKQSSSLQAGDPMHIRRSGC